MTKSNIIEDLRDYEQNQEKRVDERKEEQMFGNKNKQIKSIYSEDSELYYPKTEDFIRRCTNLNEAFEIIEFQLRNNSITKEEAENLKKEAVS